MESLQAVRAYKQFKQNLIAQRVAELWNTLLKAAIDARIINQFKKELRERKSKSKTNQFL